MDAVQDTSANGDKISAYYCLVFPNFTYYLQTLTVSIGRRPSSNAPSSSDPKDIVDIDLGPLSQVSRLHARIEYDEDQERFVLAIFGRNGAWVDSIWYASGRRVPLGARTQIMIASQTFHFILPSQESDDSVSVTTSSSSQDLSLSVDIMSMSPTSERSMSPHQPSTVEQNRKSSISRPAKQSKKRRRKSSTSIPATTKSKATKSSPPEEMPPKPAITYANLSYLAIKAQKGRATLQQVCTWIADNYDWYRLNEGTGWESSVRHTLSSNKAFTKVSRKEGKGFDWTVTPSHEAALEAQNDPTSTASSLASKDPPPAAKRKERPLPHDPPFRRSVLHEPKSRLPPPLTNVPLPTPATTPAPSTPGGVGSSHQGVSPPQPPQAPLDPKDIGRSQLNPDNDKTNTSGSRPTTAKPVDHVSNAASVVFPIIVKELPPDHPAVVSSSAAQTNPASAFLKVPPIVHDRSNNTLVLNPVVFGNLDEERIKELQGLGFQEAIQALKPQIVQFVKERLTSNPSKTKKIRKTKVKPSKDASVHSGSHLNVASEEKGLIQEDAVAGSDGPPSKKRKMEKEVDVVS